MHIGMSLRGRTSEITRDVMRWLFERDPMTILTARRAACAVAATHETADKLRRWGVRNVVVIPSVGVSPEDLPSVATAAGCDYEFISIGRLLDWKGFHLGLRAFARANIAGARYAIVGEGPEEYRLKRLARELGIESRVDFLGHVSRDACLRTLARSRMLVHPSLHDSGGFVLVEAMALGKPVICLHIGGPAVIVDDSSGIRIRAADSEQTIQKLVEAMKQLHDDRALYDKLSRGAFERGHREFLWSRKMQQVNEVYTRALADARAKQAALLSCAYPGAARSAQAQGGAVLEASSKKSADVAA
jgi:glycosyltransferase involved in cell wall biosynthesis